MGEHSDGSEDNHSPRSNSPLLGDSSMSSGEHELLYSASGPNHSPLQRKNKLGLHVDVEAANKLAETKLQNKLSQTEPDDEIDVKIEAGSNMPLFCKYCSNVSLTVYLLVIIFGSGSWIAVNGVWVELPLLVPRLPEDWDLPSYLSVCIQLANIGPLVFFIAFTLNPDKVKEKPVVYGIVVLGAVSCFLLAFFWDHTTYIAGAEHSTALLILTFCLAFVDCTSSVVFLPFMAIFPEEYLTAFYIGEGFSGLAPSLVSLGQGAGNYNCTNVTYFTNSTANGTVEKWKIVPTLLEPNFPIEDFYFFLFVMMSMCGIAFVLLNYLPQCKKYHLEEEPKPESPESSHGNGLLAGQAAKDELPNNESLSERKPLAPLQLEDSSLTSTPIKDKSARTEETELPSPISREFSPKLPVRMKHRSSPGGVANDGLPDMTDGDDSVFAHTPSSSTRRRHYSLITNFSRQNSYKPSRRRLSSFGPMDMSFSKPDLHPLPEERPEDLLTATTPAPNTSADAAKGQLTRKDYIYLLTLITLVNALSNGVLPSTQTYSALPYGTLIYSLVVRLSNVMNPLACFIAFFLPTKSYRLLAIITAVAVCFAAYTLTLAGMSPHPPLHDSIGGGILAVIAWLTVSGLFSYTKVIIAMILRDDGRNGLIWCGALTQVGSTIGAVLTFILVNVLDLFTSANYCSS